MKEKDKIRARNKRRHFRRKYGLEPEHVTEMIARQGGGCAICNEVTLRMHVDHDHLTGKVRAILCFRCNAALGLLRDRADLVERMAQYVRTHQGAQL